VFVKGVEQDSKRAFELYEQAAKQGLSQAQAALAAAYYHGRSVKQDLKQAAVYFAKAAEQGHAEAQLNLGMLYEQGHGIFLC
jgi:uncharacterized protein